MTTLKAIPEKNHPKGVIVPVITPFHFSEILPLLDHIIAGGVSTIFLLGTTGEASMLNLKQKQQLIKMVASHIGKRAQLIVGITCSNITDTLHMFDVVNEAEAFASVFAPRVLGEHCAASIENLLAHSEGKIILYNFPALSGGHPIPLEDIRPFLSEKRVLGIKDSSGNKSYFDELLKSSAPYPFSVYYGSESGLSDALKKNIDGFVPSTGNLEPKLCCEIWEKKENGPWEDWHKVKAAIKNTNPECYISALKMHLKERNMISNATKLNLS